MAQEVGILARLTGKDKNAWWKATRTAEKRLKRSKFYERNNWFKGTETKYGNRPIIGRDRRINGGVYVGPVPGEAIVVDDSKDEYLAEIYDILIKIREKAATNGYGFKDGLLEDIYDLVKRTIPSSKTSVKSIVEEFVNDQKIYLSDFFGEGVCRHQALLAAYLLEKLADNGLIQGKVSFDSNYVRRADNSREFDGHAWVRYTNSAGKVIILDTAQEYLGNLDEIDRRDRWAYERPEDIAPHLKIFGKIRQALLGVRSS